ncbi:MAG: peptidoglycan DD-metalloendopeptidase family protein [Anaerolineae bacterium]
MAHVTAAVWRWGGDRRAVAAFVGRYSAHLAIVALALLVGLVGRVAWSPTDVVVSSAPRGLLLPAAAEPVATPTAHDADPAPIYELAQPEAVVRRANPRTTIPERERLEVITYTVQEGDNIFWIAERFKLLPTTVVWSNMETLQGAPWLINAGLSLAIPPVDGVYHTVVAGETPAAIAEQYEVPVEALYNQWNAIEPGQSLAEGTQLVIPGAVGSDIKWEPDPPEPSAPAVGVASASWGYCGDTAVSGYGANGWFILPTGSYEVSGWVFRDPRNPGHIGLDYRCRLGDPIYAADAGVVVWAGWNGGYGNLVRVSHGNGFETYYAHFSAYAVGCGDPVAQGQIVGYCGSTGWSTGPHLHYEIRLNGVPQNPKLYEP